MFRLTKLCNLCIYVSLQNIQRIDIITKCLFNKCQFFFWLMRRTCSVLKVTLFHGILNRRVTVLYLLWISLYKDIIRCLLPWCIISPHFQIYILTKTLFIPRGGIKINLLKAVTNHGLMICSNNLEQEIKKAEHVILNIIFQKISINIKLAIAVLSSFFFQGLILSVLFLELLFCTLIMNIIWYGHFWGLVLSSSFCCLNYKLLCYWALFWHTDKYILVFFSHSNSSEFMASPFLAIWSFPPWWFCGECVSVRTRKRPWISCSHIFQHQLHLGFHH